MRESYGKGLANHPGPEPYAGGGEHQQHANGLLLQHHPHLVQPRAVALIAANCELSSPPPAAGDFFPHYIDQPLLFPSREGGQNRPFNWPSGKIDYIMLSGLSCSPNQLYYMPTKTGIPDEDKAEIRKWLDWGRKNIAYLKVRKDLPDWPAAGKVDGSAHICTDRGLIFLFNPGKSPLSGQFALTDQSIGLKAKGTFQITQEYLKSDRTVKAPHGETVRWQIPGETAVILNVKPVK